MMTYVTSRRESFSSGHPICGFSRLVYAPVVITGLTACLALLPSRTPTELGFNKPDHLLLFLIGHMFENTKEIFVL